jgi:hypothetical protein
VIAGESDDHLSRAALWDTAERLRATLPDEMAMVELRHIKGATYNEIGDLIGDGSSRVAARTWVRDPQKGLRAVSGVLYKLFLNKWDGQTSVMPALISQS